ncbi:MAG: TlpA family protein disulfide reductase [Flavobacteriales bacterium]|nr:TlpA family protein disulfide reductase [Flavobacteriales bacterium]
MKKLLIPFVAFCLMAFTQVDNADLAVNDKKVPSVKVKTLDGGTFDMANISNDGKPIVISFWATWCSPCKKELENMAEVYEEWQKETGVKIIAISIDDARNSSKVKPYIMSKELPYDVYIDENQDFKRAMNVNNVPHTFLVDGNGNIVWDHNNYSEGDEEHLYEEIKKLVGKH